MWEEKGVRWLGFYLFGQIFTKRPVSSQKYADGVSLSSFTAKSVAATSTAMANY